MVKQLQRAKNVEENSAKGDGIGSYRRQMEDEFEQFKKLSQQEISRLKTQQNDIDDAISIAKSEIQSEAASSHYKGGFGTNTMTSDFSMDTVDVEDLRQQLSAASIELE